MDVLYIVIPAYNEEANIRALIEEWYPVIRKHNGGGLSRLVIIDDGSRDETAAAVREAAETRPLLELIQKENGGHGSAVLAGYRYAVKNKADYIFQTDSDRQTLPSEFEGFWRQRTRFEAVIGERRARQDGAGRIAVTKTLKALLFVLFQEYIPDANAPYRLMRREALREALSYIDDGECVPNIMISAIFAKQKRRVLYRDVTFRKRQGGTNSLNVRRIFSLGTEAFGRLMKLKNKLS